MGTLRTAFPGERGGIEQRDLQTQGPNWCILVPLLQRNWEENGRPVDTLGLHGRDNGGGRRGVGRDTLLWLF